MKNIGEMFPPEKKDEPIVYDLDSDIEKTKGETMLIGPELVEDIIRDMKETGKLISDENAIREAINMLPDNYKEALIREARVNKKERPGELH